MMTIIILLSAFIAFTLSASAGLGGSLILVPILVILLGAKSGIALAAMLLAVNNVAKVFFYRKTIPVKAAFLVIVLTIVGAGFGAKLLVSLNEDWVQIAVIASIALTLVAEKKTWHKLQNISAPVLAFLAGTSSGISGTSGPLKGIALRNLRLPKAYLVGAASIVSLVNDLTKTFVFMNHDLIPEETLVLFMMAIPLMPVASYLGKHINQNMGERAYSGLFWIVMFGYSARLLLT